MMNRNVLNSFLIIIVFVFFLISSVFAQVRVVVQGEIKNIVESSIIKLNINPCCYAAIYKDMISIGLDNPYIKAKDFRVLDEPRLEYIPSFRKNKKLFFRLFQLEVFLEFALDIKNRIEQELQKSNIMISFLQVDRKGKTSSKILLIALNDKINQEEVKKVKNKDESVIYKNLKPLCSLNLNKEVLNNDNSFGQFNFVFKNFYLFLFFFLLLTTLSFYLLFLSIKKNSKSYFIASLILFSFPFSFLAKFILFNMIINF